MSSALLFLLSLLASLHERYALTVAELGADGAGVPVEGLLGAARATAMKLYRAANSPWAGNFVGKCKCGRRHAAVDAIAVTVQINGKTWYPAIVSGSRVIVQGPSGNYRGACECGRTVALRPVLAKLSKVHVCNAKCMSSHGPACECSCGGRNHGRSFAAL